MEKENSLNKLKDLCEKSKKHTYYCSQTNYHNNDGKHSFDTWEEFKNEWNLDDIDFDLNLLFRFDLKYDLDNNYYYLELFFILQRKGIFLPLIIENIHEKDADEIIEFLEKAKNHLFSLWK